MDLNAQLKLFVDTAAVQQRVDAANLKLLGRLGAFVRRRAQTSMRRRKAASKPGEPPSVHAGQLRKLIFFGVETASGSPTLVVGPTLFGRRRATPVTELHEYGGDVSVKDRVFTVREKVRGRNRDRTVKHTGIARYPARPYMAPAFEAEVLGGKLSTELQDYI